MSTDNGSSPDGAAAAPRGVDALESVATAAALVVARRTRDQPGDFIVVIRGAIRPGEMIEDLGWEWFWRPPAERSPATGPISTKEKQ